MMKRWIFVFGLAACGGSPKPAPEPAPAPVAPTPTPAPTPAASGDCTGAINNTMVVSGEELKKQPPAIVALIPQITSIMIKHCTEDKWSAETISCMATGKTGEEQQKCQGMLTPDQGQKVTAELQTLIQTAMSKQ